MPVLAQHGYGKGDKIHEAIAAGHVCGAILSPRYESPLQMEGLVRSLREAGGDHEPIVAVDPQLYVAVVQGANDGKLREYPYYSPDLRRSDFARPARLASIARDALEYQEQVGATVLLSPTVPFYAFDDQWCMVALSLANESIARRPPGSRLWVSVVLDEGCLMDSDGLAQFLDDVSLLECDGFYVILNRHTTGHPGYLRATSLANLMYLTNALGELGGFEVTVGYSDLLGLTQVAAGATNLATGWFANLKQFSMTRFEPSGPMRQPKKRYTSLPLLSSISVSPELQTIYELGDLDLALSSTGYDDELRRGPASAPWTADSACQHNWECLARACTQLATQPVRNRLEQLATWVGDANALYKRFGASMPFDSNSGSRHLNEWLEAIERFRALAGMTDSND